MIRALTAKDREAWSALWTDYLTFYETTLAQEIYDSTWNRLLDPSEPIWGALAELDGVPMGITHFIYHRTGWAIAPACYLQDLYVAPAARGTGLGRALIDHVTADAGSKGCARVHWLTHETNVTARRLYDDVAVRSGFIQYRKATS